MDPWVSCINPVVTRFDLNELDQERRVASRNTVEAEHVSDPFHMPVFVVNFIRR